MIGPHYQKIAEVENRFNTRELLQRVQSKSSNPLTQIVEKLKNQFSEYQTAYDDTIIDHQINSVDRLLSFDGKLGPILSGLEKENNLLRKELSVMESQLSNTVGICEQILGENSHLKQIISGKNQDIEKMIETIALNESEARSGMQDKIDLLQQENSILIRHLEEVKREHQNYAARFEEEKSEGSMWKAKWEESKRVMQQTLQNEQELSRRLSLSEHNLYSETEKVYDLQQSNTALLFENNELKGQIGFFQSEEKQHSLEALSQRMESQYAHVVEEHRQLKAERTQLLREAEKGKLENERLQDRLESLEKQTNKWQSDLEKTASLLSEEKQKSGSLRSTIARLEQRVEELRQEGNKLRLENESVHGRAQARERVLEREVEKLAGELDRKGQEMDSRLREIREKTGSLVEAKDAELRSLNDTNIELRKILERRQAAS